MRNPLLSVCLITYNHISFIEQAIKSVLAQKVNFTWEIIIADDCSTDGTTEVVKKYASLYPQLIKAIVQNPNVGAANNFIELIQTAKGKYIAEFDGDDYWTNPHKLQIQVDFLEANPDFAICFHNVQIVYADNSQESQCSNAETPEVLDFNDLASRNYISTVSCVFRNQEINFPDWYKDMAAGDYPLHLINAQHGKIRYFDEVMAVYRVHAGGVWSVKSDIERYLKWVVIVETCRKHFAPRGEETFSRQLAHCYKELCFAYFSQGKYAEFRQYYAKCLKNINHLGVRTVSALSIRHLLSFVPFAAVRYNTVREAKRSSN